jgi:Tol biopolymer transport system component
MGSVMRSAAVYAGLVPMVLLSTGACGGDSNADSLTGDADSSTASTSGGSDETASGTGDDATSGAETSGDGDGDGDGDACPNTETPWSSGATQAWVVSQTSVGNSISDAVFPAVSGDGRWVAYASGYGLDGVLREDQSLFIADNACGEIFEGPVVLPVSPAVAISVAISDDGSTVAYLSRVPSIPPLVEGYVYDVATDSTERFDVDPQGNPVEDELDHISLSADGRYLAFDARSDELVVDDSNLSYDVFVRDLEAGTTERVSLRTDGNQANGASQWPEITADGRKVMFASRAPSLSDSGTSVGTHLYLRDLDTQTTVALSPQAGLTDGQSSGDFGDISADGRFVVFETDVPHLDTDTDTASDIYLLDRMTDTLEHVSADISADIGGCRLPRVSDDGNAVVFEILDDFDAAVRDRTSNKTTRIREHTVSEAPGTINNMSISADGQWIVFLTEIKDIVEPPIPGGVYRNVIMVGTP